MNESMSRSNRTSTADTKDPIAMLKEDHKNVKELFDQFEDANDEQRQMEIANKAINELKVHAAIEEEIFYPAVEPMVDDSELMSEATEEHHVAHFLIDELENENLDHDTFHAKFIVLAENVRHHIKEEEGEMMPKIDRDEATMEDLGTRMAERKQELMENPDTSKRKTRNRASTKQGTQSNLTRQRASRRGSKDADSKGPLRTRKPGRSGSKPSSPGPTR